MSKATDSLLSYIRAVSGTWRNDPRDDAELITRFAEKRDEMAFAALVYRHGALVWQTCRRLLGDTPDAEDAFQTVFLALTREAGRFPVKNLVGWLYLVARRTALKNRSRIGSRQNLEQAVAKTEAKEDVNQTELYAGLDEELAHLPEKLRVPLLLHFIEGKSQIEVAKILGCARSALQKRLAQGEIVLRKRLERRGLTLGTASVVALLGNISQSPAVPAGLIANTARAAVAFRAGRLTGGAADGAQKLLRALNVKLAMQTSWWLVLTSVCCLGIGKAGLIAWRMYGDGSKAVGPDVSAITIAISPKKAVSELRNQRVDFYGDPLPDRALACIGTMRFRGPAKDPVSLEERELQSGVALSPDGKTLVMGCREDGLNYWDATSGKKLCNTSDGDRQVAFSFDGKLLAVTEPGSSGPGSRVRLLDSATGHSKGDFLGGDSPVFAPDGKILACRTDGSSFTLYDVATKKPLRSMKVANLGKSYLTFAVFSSDVQCLACVETIEEAEGTVHLLDVKTGKETATLKKRKVVALAFTADSKIVTAGQDKIVRVWDAKTGEELRALGEMDWNLPTLRVSPLVAILPDGKTAIVACPGQIRFWDVTSGNQTRPPLTCKNLRYPAFFSVDGTKLIERVGNAISIWDTATGKETGPTSDAPRSLMDSLAFSPDGKMLVTVTDPDVLVYSQPGGGVAGIDFWKGRTAFQVWEIATGKPLGSLAVSSETSVRCFGKVTWPSPDTILAQANLGEKSDKGTLAMLRWTEVSPRSKASKHEVYFDCAGFSQDSQVWVRRQSGSNLELLDVSSSKKFAEVPSQSKGLYHGDCLALSADHQVLATQPLASSDGLMRDLAPAIKLWNVSTGRELYSLDLPVTLPLVGPPQKLPKVDELIGFSVDGRLIATKDPEANSVSLWEHASGQRRLRLATPEGCSQVEHVTFSPDNRLIAAGCVVGPKQIKSVCVWDLATGQECQRFQGRRMGGCLAPTVAFSSDGRRLATSGMDYTVLIWDVEQKPITARVNKSLNQKELQTLKIELTGADGEAANRAIWRLQQVPEQAIPLVIECLHTQSCASTEHVVQEVNQLIHELDSNDFKTRSKAAEQLDQKLREEYYPIVEDILRRVKKPSLEVSKTIGQMLSRINAELQSKGWGGAKSPELTRMFRAIEVLEKIDNGPARELLAKLVEVSPRPEVQKDAQAALKRLAASRSGLSQ